MKPTVLVLMAGPKFDLDWEFGDRLRGLSRFSGGCLITSSSTKRRVQMGAYSIISTLHDPTSRFGSTLAKLRFLRCAFNTLAEARRSGHPFDIIVTYDPLLTGCIAWLLSARSGAKLICEVNGDYIDPANFMHERFRWARSAKRWLAGIIVRFNLGRSSGIRILFPEQLDRINYIPRPGQVIAQFHEFVNIAAFRNLGEKPRLLLIGFPFYVKGVDLAIAAFKRIAGRFPAWTLEIVGHFPEHDELDAAIGDSKQIKYRKPVLHRNMNEHIGSCAIVIQPSRTESMGRVLVEAMAASKPRIATRVGGIPTVVDNGSDGILVDPGDIEGLADAMALLMKDAELRRSMGEAGCSRAAREFSEEAYFAEVAKLFERVLAADKSLPPSQS